MRDSKGLGNLKNLFFYASNGKADGIKIVPLSEVATIDVFFISRKSVRATCLMHNASRSSSWAATGKCGFDRRAKVFVRNELMPLESRFLKLNEWAGEEIIRFQKYSFDTDNE